MSEKQMADKWKKTGNLVKSLQEYKDKNKNRDALLEMLQQETTKAILKQFFRGDRTKLSEDAAQLVAEVASLAVVEATLRAGKQAKTEGSTTIQAEHVEKVLPQLVTDL